MEAVFQVEVGQNEGENLLNDENQELNPDDDFYFSEINATLNGLDQDTFSTDAEPEDLNVSKRGRPSVAFEKASRSTKQILAAEMDETHITDELAMVL